MIILPIKSRQQILKEREKPDFFCSSGCLMLFKNKTPEKNLGPTSKYRSTDFVRTCIVVSKKIHLKAVVRNKLRRRIKEAFRNIDKTLLENQHDYQIIAKHSIFSCGVDTIKKHIENCLNGVGIIGLPERKMSQKSKNTQKLNLIKTSKILRNELK